MATSESKFLVLGILFILGGVVSIGYGIIYYSYYSIKPILVFSGLFAIVIGIYFCQPEHSEHGENRELKDQFWDYPRCHRKNLKTAKRCSRCGFFISEEEQKT